MPDKNLDLHLIIRGRVQGVFYRASAQQQAKARDLGGWVRNRDDGGVEVRVAGPGAAVRELLEWCRLGPPAARVDDVEVHEVVGAREGVDVPHPFVVRRG